ncbi:uncharacterized protein RCO7_09483 [Rhynchosporium graminicola]|uniref:N-acetyltransferase domain-containing protein n=1 Tax=Rhynchosporium graminicola TaxID=2792576 RepID=A0A1E1K6C6_9HELO|nr:uncharacterized protein RCO7_09483 [Rhynchosporium commune]
MAEAFATDPILTYLLPHMTPTQFTAYLPKFFDSLLGAAAMNEGIFTEANDFSSCTILMPPGCHVDNLWTLLPADFIGMVWGMGVKATYRMLGELGPKTDAVKLKALHGQKKYYYTFFTATHAKDRGRGLCSKIIKEIQAKAQKDGLRVWIEGTTENSASVYAKCGFELVENIEVGEGLADTDGKFEKGGESVTTRGMVWWPKGQDEKKLYPVVEKRRGNWVAGTVLSVISLVLAVYVALYLV